MNAIILLWNGPGASAFTAFVFALHPLHVGSVAWIAERKDVLSACFFFLGLYAYVRYTERESLPRYAPVAVSFALALMSKPMLVTFPFMLLLLDVWPLRRGRSRKLLLEKVPLLGIEPQRECLHRDVEVRRLRRTHDGNVVIGIARLAGS